MCKACEYQIKRSIARNIYTITYNHTVVYIARIVTLQCQSVLPSFAPLPSTQPLGAVALRVVPADRFGSDNARNYTRSPNRAEPTGQLADRLSL